MLEIERGREIGFGCVQEHMHAQIEIVASRQPEPS